ncbi:MAG: glutamine synthetase type III, partial [Planctomycetes bacterium]|nr:glutamine synthetase type III [Planctomycetota bacterium]
GNGYSEEWHAEAAKRGLPNVPNSVDGLACYTDEKNIQLFARHNVLTPEETRSRLNIQFEAYCNSVAIESQSALSIARTMILPAAQKTQRDVAESIAAAKALGLAIDRQAQRLRDMTMRIEAFVQCIDELAAAFEQAEGHHGSEFEHAKVYRDAVIPAMARLRVEADQLETMTDDDYWPLPKYRELLFLQ